MNEKSPQSNPPVAFASDIRTPGAQVAGVILSMLLHLGLVAAIIAGTMAGTKQIEEEIQPKMLTFEKVDLLALGEEKPPNALPRIANPEPAVRPPDEVNLAKPEEPVVDLEKKEEKKEKEDLDARKRKMLEALSALNNPNRPTNEDLPEGAENGVVGGDISDAALANLMGTYAAKLIAELSRSWEIPSTVPDDEIPKLAGLVAVYVRLSEEGHVVVHRFEKHSPNEQFDASIDRLLRRYTVTGGRKLPLPDDDQVKASVLHHGLQLEGWEYTGR